jgi:hypothetical protein
MGHARSDERHCRLCQNHPQSAIAISLNAEWIIEQLAEDAHLKGDLRSGGNGSTQSYRRWAVGPIVGIFRVLPLDDRTVVVEGFTPNS